MTPVQLLEWLAREDSSALGECKGAALDVLIDYGLATIIDPQRGDFARVRVTAEGHAELRRVHT